MEIAGTQQQVDQLHTVTALNDPPLFFYHCYLFSGSGIPGLGSYPVHITNFPSVLFLHLLLKKTFMNNRHRFYGQMPFLSPNQQFKSNRGT